MQRLDSLALPAGTAAAAPLNIPHGSPPSTAVNGDVWTTSAGIYVQINGATVGPLSAGGGLRKQTLSSNYKGFSEGNAIVAGRYHAPTAQTISVLLTPGSQQANIIKVGTSGGQTVIGSAVSAGYTASISLAANEGIAVVPITDGSSFLHVEQTP